MKLTKKDFRIKELNELFYIEIKIKEFNNFPDGKKILVRDSDYRQPFSFNLGTTKGLIKLPIIKRNYFDSLIEAENTIDDYLKHINREEEIPTYHYLSDE